MLCSEGSPGFRSRHASLNKASPTPPYIPLVPYSIRYQPQNDHLEMDHGSFFTDRLQVKNEPPPFSVKLRTQVWTPCVGRVTSRVINHVTPSSQPHRLGWSWTDEYHLQPPHLPIMSHHVGSLEIDPRHERPGPNRLNLYVHSKRSRRLSFSRESR